MLNKLAGLLLLIFGATSIALAQTPTISGVRAFWWLGSGILSDQGYYAQSLLTAAPNGLSGTASWSVSTVSGGGSVTITCNPSPSNCTQATATSTAPSNGCTYDVSVYVTIGGVQSAAYTLAIIEPHTATLQGSYPSTPQNPPDSALGVGFQTIYTWNLTDTCGNNDGGIDESESFGTQTNVVANNWNPFSNMAGYQSSSTMHDYFSNVAGTSPQVQNPGYVGTYIVFYAPWEMLVGSATPGAGLPIYRPDISGYTDYSIIYLDHGRHCTTTSGC